LARLGTEVSPAAATEWGFTQAARVIRKGLNHDLQQLTDIYAKRARTVFAEIDRGIDTASVVTSTLAGLALGLALLGVGLISGSVTRPLRELTNATKVVADGDTHAVVPFSERKDEIGALSRSIAVFQQAMRRNAELNGTIVAEAETRSARQKATSSEIAR